jgi:hypothetical protein
MPIELIQISRRTPAPSIAPTITRGMPLQIAGEVRVNDVLANHRAIEGLGIEHVTLDPPHASIALPRLQPPRFAEVECQSRVGSLEEYVGGDTGDLPVGAENQDIGHVNRGWFLRPPLTA